MIVSWIHGSVTWYKTYTVSNKYVWVRHKVGVEWLDYTAVVSSIVQYCTLLYSSSAQ